jgi:mRNA-degrading endonuclease RelE of RelBE toxin-antitoxin system
MFSIAYAPSVAGELRSLRATDRKRILDAIENQLTQEPANETRNRKILAGVAVPWEHQPPVWELRVGNYRVFYDVDEVAETVTVRAIREKPPHKTLGEIL